MNFRYGMIAMSPREGFFEARTMLAIRSYITEALEELRHTRWPTRQQAIRLSVIVLGFTAVSAALFGIVDFLLSEIVSILLSASI